MPDIIDVVHRITYDVNDAELVKATNSIRNQIDYFVKLNELVLKLKQRLDSLSDGNASRTKIESTIDKLNIRIKEHGASLTQAVSKSKVWQASVSQEMALLAKATKGYERLNDASKTKTTQSGGVLSSLSSLGNIGGGVMKTMQSVIDFVDTIEDAINKLDALTKEYAKQETATLQLQNSLRQFGEGEYFQDLTTQAQKLSDQLGYINNDEILAAQEALVSFGKLGGEQIKELTSIIAEYAANQHVSIADATDVFINGLNGQTDAFKNINVVMKNGGDVAANYKQIITEVFAKVSGSAQAFGSTTEGQIQKLKTMFADFKEKIGEGVAYVLFGPPEKMKTQQQLLEETRVSFNAQMDALKNGNLPLESRKMLIDEINTKYAAYLPQLLTEKSTLEEITKAQNESNDAMLQHILYLEFQDKLQALNKKKFDGYKIQGESATESERLNRDGVEKYNGLRPGELAPSMFQKMKNNNTGLIAAGKLFGQNIVVDAEAEINKLYAEYEQAAKAMRTSLAAIFKKYGVKTSSSSAGGLAAQPLQKKDYKKDELEPIQTISNTFLSVDKPNETIVPVDTNAMLGRDAEEKKKQEEELAAKRKQQILDAVADYQTLAQAVADAYNTIVQVQIDALDKEISIREKRVAAAQKLAERGNVEALKIEEDRLQKAQEMRAQFARRQQAVNAAITVSNAIAAVARAALEGGGFGSVATIAALLAALAAGYAAVTSMSNDNAYADGVIDFKGKGGPRDDANWVRISSGESVITAEGTRRNRHLLEAINNGAQLQFVNPALAYTMPAFANPQFSSQGYASSYDLRIVEGKLDGVISAIEDNRMKQNIFFNEHGVGIMTERAVRKDRKRWM